MREKGLGTPATRAPIIEGLISEKYIHRKGRELHADGQGVFADDAAARPRRSGALLAGADRRLGIQARADGARQARARRVHARDRRDDRAHRRPGQGATRATRFPATSRRSTRRARSAAARSTRTTRSSSARPATSRFWKIMGGRQLEPREADTLLRGTPRSARSTASAAGWAGRSRPSLKLTDANEVSFDFGERDGDDDGEAPDFTGAGAARPLPEVRRRASSRLPQCLRLREGRRARTRPATSAPAA